MLKRLALAGVIIVGFAVLAMPAIEWGMGRGVTGVASWAAVIVIGGLVMILAEIIAGGILEGAAAWVGSKLPEPVTRGLGKRIGGPLALLGLLAIISAALIALVASTT